MNNQYLGVKKNFKEDFIMKEGHKEMLFKG